MIDINAYSLAENQHYELAEQFRIITSVCRGLIEILTGGGMSTAEIHRAGIEPPLSILNLTGA